MPTTALTMKLALLTSMLFGLLSCSDTRRFRASARDILVSLSNAQEHSEFAGSLGEATDRLVERRRAQKQPLTIRIVDGDAPAPIGDGSCQLHAFVSTAPTVPPFVGIRMKKEANGWHIAGYWTP